MSRRRASLALGSLAMSSVFILLFSVWGPFTLGGQTGDSSGAKTEPVPRAFHPEVAPPDEAFLEVKKRAHITPSGRSDRSPAAAPLAQPNR